MEEEEHKTYFAPLVEEPSRLQLKSPSCGKNVENSFFFCKVPLRAWVMFSLEASWNDSLKNPFEDNHRDHHQQSASKPFGAPGTIEGCLPLRMSRELGA